MPKNSAVKAVGFMMVITLVGKMLGLLRDQCLANSFGITMEANAFMTASRIPRIFFDAVFASAISSSFIPVFNEYMERKGKNAAFQLSHRFITFVTVCASVLAVLGMVAAEPLTAFFADGFDFATASLCTSLLRMMFPIVIFTGIAYSFVGILQSLGEFGIPAALSIVSNGIIILYYILFNQKFGVYGLAAAFLVGWGMQAVMQLPALRRKGYHYRPSLSLKDPGLRKIMVLMLPVMVSAWVQPINIAINTKYASRLFDGAGVSAIEYANTLYTIIVGVFVLSVANVIFPELSRMTTNQKEREFGQTIRTTMGALLFLLIPMMVGLMALSTPLIRLAYERGEFTQEATLLTSKALFFLSLGMIGFGIQSVLSRAYYAVQDGKTPLLSGVASIITNIVLCMLLVEKFDVAGLAIASAAGSIVSALFLWVPMSRKYHFLTKVFFQSLGKMLIAAGLMVAAVLPLGRVMATYLPNTTLSKLLLVGVPAVAGFVLYMTVTWFLSVKESKMAVSFCQNIWIKMKKRFVER